MVSPLCEVYVQLVQTKPISNVILCLHYFCVQVAAFLLAMALVSIGYHLHITYVCIAQAPHPQRGLGYQNWNLRFTQRPAQEGCETPHHSEMGCPPLSLQQGHRRNNTRPHNHEC